VKLITIVGARPQFIKAAAVSRALRAADSCAEILVHTGQHYDPSMSAIFFDELDMPQPDHNLGIGSGPHAAQTGRMLEAIERVLISQQPDCVLIYGDTNSTLAGALAAAKLCIPVAHVEAGLRSHNRRMPEEINRVVADHLSTILFAPTSGACQQLRREGIADTKVHRVGDVMYDIALQMAERAAVSSRILARLGLAPREYAFCTVHRAENTGDPQRLRTILNAIGKLSLHIPVILPLHPRTARALADYQFLAHVCEGVRLIEPLGYLDATMLQKNAALTVTDSGGVQKEAFFHRVPCVTLREETEWTELVELGWNRLAPPHDAAQMYQAMRDALGTRGCESNPYGDGDAARKLVAILLREFAAAPASRVEGAVAG
jgi:UDP-GlcNAc3NAcA epimerase